MSSYDCESVKEHNEIAGFVGKAFQILSNQEYSKIIYWGVTGRQFVIKDTNKFQEIVLPKYFRHKKINSFIRQLNMYGFHKSRKDNSKSIFSHENFIKNREDLLPLIKRKIKVHLVTQEDSPIKEKKERNQKKLLDTAQKEKAESVHQIDNAYQLGTLKCFLESRENINSRFNLNFSLKKVSMNNFDEVQDEMDNEVSLELNMEKQGQKQNDAPMFTNPSCFFGSFVGGTFLNNI